MCFNHHHLGNHVKLCTLPRRHLSWRLLQVVNFKLRRFVDTMRPRQPTPPFSTILYWHLYLLCCPLPICAFTSESRYHCAGVKFPPLFRTHNLRHQTGKGFICGKNAFCFLVNLAIFSPCHLPLHQKA